MPSVWSEVYMRFFFLDCSLSLKKKKKNGRQKCRRMGLSGIEVLFFY